MSADAPTVTVVVPTFRRGPQLAALLDALEAQVDPAHEVIVVDNDAAGSARAAVARRPWATYLHHPTPGASHARNAGIAAASGAVLVMVDDDVVPQPGWLAALLQPIVDGRADVTGGRVVLDPGVARPAWFDEDVVGAYLTHFDLGDGPRPLHADEHLVSASAAAHLHLVRAVGGFDPELGPRGGIQLVADDVALVRALRAAGARVWWVPDALVVHELPASRLRPRWLLRRAWLQGRSDRLLDATAMADRRLGGARVALSWLGDQVRRRLGEGVWRPAVAFHLACDLARTAGWLRQAAARQPDRRVAT